MLLLLPCNSWTRLQLIWVDHIWAAWNCFRKSLKASDQFLWVSYRTCQEVESRPSVKISWAECGDRHANFLTYHSARHSKPFFAPPSVPGIHVAQFVQFSSEWIAPGLWQWSPHPSQKPQFPSLKHHEQFRPRCSHPNESVSAASMLPEDRYSCIERKIPNTTQKVLISFTDIMAVHVLLRENTSSVLRRPWRHSCDLIGSVDGRGFPLQLAGVFPGKTVAGLYQYFFRDGFRKTALKSNAFRALKATRHLMINLSLLPFGTSSPANICWPASFSDSEETFTSVCLLKLEIFTECTIYILLAGIVFPILFQLLC